MGGNLFPRFTLEKSREPLGFRMDWLETRADPTAEVNESAISLPFNRILTLKKVTMISGLE